MGVRNYTSRKVFQLFKSKLEAEEMRRFLRSIGATQIRIKHLRSRQIRDPYIGIPNTKIGQYWEVSWVPKKSRF